MEKKPTVLVVDDIRANALALEGVLGSDYNVLLARSGREAIALLGRPHEVDVILMDVQMPAMDGFEAAARIKQLAGCEELPIIFVSAVFTEDPFIKRGYQVGAVDYFAKPFDPDVLRLKVGIYASFRQRAQLLRARELHVRTSEELVRVGRMLSSVLESLPIGVLIADAAGRICQATEEVSRILNYDGPLARDSYGEMMGWWDAAGRIIKDLEGPLGHALRDGRSTHNARVTIPCLDGTSKVVLVSASPLRGVDGQRVGAVVLLQDFTETTRVERDLEQRVARLIGAGIEIEASLAR